MVPDYGAEEVRMPFSLTFCFRENLIGQDCKVHSYVENIMIFLNLANFIFCLTSSVSNLAAFI